MQREYAEWFIEIRKRGEGATQIKRQKMLEAMGKKKGNEKKGRMLFRCECGGEGKIYHVFEAHRSRRLRQDSIVSLTKISTINGRMETNLPEGIYCASCNKFLGNSISAFIMSIHQPG